jgi:PAS domain S-box-containing protein
LEIRNADALAEQPSCWRELKPWEAYCFVLVVTAITLGLRLAFDEALGGRPTLVIFTMPIMLSAYVGGLRAGLLATAVTYFAASYYLLPPFHSFAVASSVDRWQQFFVVLAGVLISVLNEALHRARRRADLFSRKHLQAKNDWVKVEALQAAIFHSAYFSIIATDEKGIIQIFNVGAERLLGYTAAEVVNRITPADLHDPQEVIARATALSIECGTPITPGFEALVFKAARGIEDIYEVTKVRKDGSRFPAMLSITALRDERQNIIGYLLIGIDNTARKQADVELQHANAKLKAWAQALNSFAIVEETNPQGRITYVNEPFCRISKYRREELLGKDHREVVSSGTHPKEFWKEMWRTISHGKIWRGEIKNCAKDGTVYWVDTVIVPLLGADARPETYLAIRFVITERKMAEEEWKRAEKEVQSLNMALERRVLERTTQLNSANKELEAFSYSVSHDLRAPLRHVSGFVELLQRDAGASLSEKSLRYLNTISNSAQRMGELIDDLLTFSRIGKSELQKTNVSLDALVGGVMGDFQVATNERSIRWEVQPLPTVWADPALIRLVLVNLMSNAVKFSGKRTEAKIEIGSSTSPSGDSVIFIRDNGAGFDPSYAAKLFGVFQRLHSSDEFEGTGIGLANVQRIIHRHGGRVWAEGVVDGGATFTFSIPQQPTET